MRYLLDTSTCSQVLNQRSQKLIERLAIRGQGQAGAIYLALEIGARVTRSGNDGEPYGNARLALVPGSPLLRS